MNVIIRASRARAAIGFALCLACAVSAEQEPFVLVEDGRPACGIVLGEQPTPAARLAALEIQSHVLRMTGAEIPIVNEPHECPGSRILAGDSAAARALGFDSKDFAAQEYVIAFRPGTLVLLGRDWTDTERNRAELGRGISGGTLAQVRHHVDYWRTVGYPERSTGEMELPGIFDEQATCYAAYDFLERFCGVRWYGPAAAHQVLPARTTLVASGEDVRRAPALKHRDGMVSGNWPFLKGQWGAFTPQELQLWWRRMRAGGEKWAANHTIHRQTIAAVLNDPAYQAKGIANGMNLCYTSPALVERLAQMARDFFDGKGELPDGFKAMGDYYAIVPEDVAKYCRCERCRDLLKLGRGQQTGFFSSGEISDYWFSFVNAVAREVAKTHPGKYIATLAYWNYAFPPGTIALEPNVSIAPCLHTCAYAINAPMRENDMRLYRGWLRQTSAPIFLWNYYHHPMEPALIEGWKCFPNVMVHETARAMRMFIEDGIRGIFICGEQDQLEHYVIAKLWDDPSADVDGLIDEFFTLYFGAAAEPMKEFYLTLERIACDPANYPPDDPRQTRQTAWANLGTSERMAGLEAVMNRAVTAAQTDIEKQRVGLWRDSIWRWMLDGREQYLAEAAAAPETHSQQP